MIYNELKIIKKNVKNEIHNIIEKMSNVYTQNVNDIYNEKKTLYDRKKFKKKKTEKLRQKNHQKKLINTTNIMNEK